MPVHLKLSGSCRKTLASAPVRLTSSDPEPPAPPKPFAPPPVPPPPVHTICPGEGPQPTAHTEKRSMPSRIASRRYTLAPSRCHPPGGNPGAERARIHGHGRFVAGELVVGVV